MYLQIDWFGYIGATTKVTRAANHIMHTVDSLILSINRRVKVDRALARFNLSPSFCCFHFSCRGRETTSGLFTQPDDWRMLVKRIGVRLSPVYEQLALRGQQWAPPVEAFCVTPIMHADEIMLCESYVVCMCGRCIRRSKIGCICREFMHVCACAWVR